MQLTVLPVRTPCADAAHDHHFATEGTGAMSIDPAMENRVSLVSPS
jgi:hypothetical protein